MVDGGIKTGFHIGQVFLQVRRHLRAACGDGGLGLLTGPLDLVQSGAIVLAYLIGPRHGFLAPGSSAAVHMINGLVKFLFHLIRRMDNAISQVISPLGKYLLCLFGGLLYFRQAGIVVLAQTVGLGHGVFG